MTIYIVEGQARREQGRAGLPGMVAQRTIQKGTLPARDLSHQPVFPLLVRSEGWALLATP